MREVFDVQMDAPLGRRAVLRMLLPVIPFFRRADRIRLVDRVAKPVHASRLCWLPHERGNLWPVTLLRHAARANLARADVAARRYERERHPLHVDGEFYERRGRVESRQSEDQLSRPHRVAR